MNLCATSADPHDLIPRHMRGAPRAQEEASSREGQVMVMVSLLRCCVRDGGRPSVVAVQAEITNHPKVRRSRAVRVERCGKRRACERVRCDPMKANESKPQMTCRNASDDFKTGSARMIRDEPGRCLLIGQVGSGMYAARAWVRLLHGTWEPALRHRDQRNGPCVHWSRKRDARVVEAVRARVALRNVRGGSSGSSDEGPVMGLERSGRAVQARSLVNREAVG